MRNTYTILVLLLSITVFSQQGAVRSGYNGIEINDTASDFSMKDTEGTDVKLSDFRNNYVLVDFWASWCAPCRIEMPEIIKLYDSYNKKGFQILGVSLDRKKEAWVEAVEKDRIPWRNISDLRGWSSNAAKIYKVISLPSNILISPDGKIIAKNLDAGSLELKLKELYP